MKYVKKPIIIEAEQFFRNKQPWPKGVYEAPCPCAEDADHFWIITLEGHSHVEESAYIVTGINGEKYPVAKDIFERSYDKVED
jgi:hypothetical protein